MSANILSSIAAVVAMSIMPGGPALANSDLVLMSTGGQTGVAVARSSGNALALASSERRRHGLGDVRADARLRTVAQRHANWMARNGQMSHRGVNGSRMADRLRAAGIGACFAAENVALGQRSDSEVIGAWMNSGSHRRSILDHRVSVGTVASAVDGVGQTYWVMLVAELC